MSDKDNDGKTGGRGRGGPGGGVRGSVRQSFSHGRSKAVVVEMKRSKRIVPPAGPAAGAGAAGAGSAGQATATPAAPATARPAGGKPSTVKLKPRGDAAPAAAPARGTEGDTQQRPRQQRPKMLNTLSEEEYARRLEALKQAKVDDERRRKAEEEEAKRRAEEEAKRRAEEEARRKAEEAEAKRRAEEEAAAEAKRKAEEAVSAPEAAAEPAPAPAPSAAAAAPRAKPAATAPEGPAGRAVEEDEGRGRGRGGPGAAKKPAPSRRAGDEKRRTGKLTISKLGDDEGGRQRSLAAMRRRQERDKRRMGGGQEPREKVLRDVRLPDAITVQELANRMAERVADVIKALMKNGIMATQNQSIDQDTAELIAEEFGHRVIRVSESAVEEAIETAEDKAEDLTPRAPIVTIMGHVDHGKTSLLDALRKTNVVAGEAGGITQHIGAYQIMTEDGHKITFLDTPGHAAFTSMRARGANVTDIVILVVAADDSVMPQTIEAIAHAKAAGVPMIVAINKIDKPGADPQKVRTQLLQHEVVVEEMSGDVLDVEVSAISGKGLDKLVEAIVLQSEILELKANPDRAAEGAVIEAKLDVGRGPVATVLVQRGTLKLGDIFVVGEQWGRVRALMNDQGERVEEAGPSEPVEVLGLQGTPEAGDTLNVVESEAKAREIADYRQRKAREKQAAQGARATLDQLLAQAKTDADVKELPLVVKADVQGSAEAIVQALEKVGNDEVRVRVLHSGVGAITESDVTLADASNTPIIGFNVRANAPAREAANQKGVEIRYYSIIYDLVDDVKQAASGLLSPEVREKYLGYAKIKQVFKVSGVGKVAGCEVTDGVARRDVGVRLLRDDVVIHEGKLKTLKRFKDEVKEVRAGQECGMAFENYEDIREGDVIEIFEREEVERTL
ncbi:translation initiation factor IF-2 [Limibaculum sp. M0105]|uniref:Translation initiation factor IF-2 n=1 Tax=Thermohalobaculum xanthum TaxID=2753746 RepID=A0A8J7MA64_9RHOB|nr:translation initiation factor IF-2 [Thermohalobaculum xanthum]MBK0401095.1 translation initiation factor IF-2 [Thermohalobaculum xanthum]